MSKMLRYTTAVLLIFICSGAARAKDVSGSLTLSVDQAVEMALKNNKSLQVQKLAPAISVEKEIQKEAAFDAAVSGGVSTSTSESSTGANSDRTRVSTEISKRMGNGSEISASATLDQSDSGAGESYSSGLSVSFAAPLLQGAGSDVNRVDILQARLDAESSAYELQGYVDSLIEQVSSAYWDYALASKKLKIYQDSLDLARQQQTDTETKVGVGKLAEVELSAARAETALREQALINLRSQADTLRLKLIRLLNPSGGDLWNLEIVASEASTIVEPDLSDAQSILAVAMSRRPDLNQARLSLKKGDLEIVKTRNGLLPYLEFFIDLGNTGYARTFSGAIGDTFSGATDATAGLNFRRTLGNRNQKSSHAQSILRNEQSRLALENMEMLAQEETLGNIIEADRAKKQIDASKATLKLQEEKFRAETEKYNVGRSTLINVAVAQRDLLQSQVDEAKARYDYIKALTALYQSQGNLSKAFNISGE